MGKTIAKPLIQGLPDTEGCVEILFFYPRFLNDIFEVVRSGVQGSDFAYTHNDESVP